MNQHNKKFDLFCYHVLKDGLSSQHQKKKLRTIGGIGVPMVSERQKVVHVF